MTVKCGRCQTPFEVTGPGRYPCPACGTSNDVRAGAEEPDRGGLLAPPPPPEPDAPSPRVVCPECGVSFIVGDVSEAPCPNCGTAVTVLGSEGDA
jgi:Zn finger protein HypA/HybF involved in hydrogenase expression